MKRFGIVISALLFCVNGAIAQMVSDEDLVSRNQEVLRGLVDRLEEKSFVKHPEGAIQDIPTARWDELSDLVVKLVIVDKHETTEGYGFALTGNGWIVTAAHVASVGEVDLARSYAVYKGTRFPVTFIQIDRSHDLGLVKAALKGEPVIKPIRFNTARLNDNVHLISQLGKNVIISTGQITFETMTSTDLGKHGVTTDSFVSSVYVKDGFSGSPIFNTLGELVGISSYGKPDNFVVTDNGVSLKKDGSELRGYSSGGAKIKYLRQLAIDASKQIAKEFIAKNSVPSLR